MLDNTDAYSNLFFFVILHHQVIPWGLIGRFHHPEKKDVDGGKTGKSREMKGIYTIRNVDFASGGNSVAIAMFTEGPKMSHVTRQ